MSTSAPPTSLPVFADCAFSFFDPTSGCYVLRSCRDCLKKAGCRIGISGHCEIDAFPPGSAPPVYYDNATANNLVLPAVKTTNAGNLATEQYWEFPSSRLSYCPTNDTVCSECIHENYWLSPGQANDSRFCLGTTAPDAGKDHCVCVANCARNDSETFCPSQVASAFLPKSLSWFWALLIVVGAVLVVAALARLGFVVYKKRINKNLPVALMVADDSESDVSASKYVAVQVPPHDSQRS